MIPTLLIKSLLFAKFKKREQEDLIRPNKIDWSISLQPETVEVRGHKIFYIKRGEGKPLILIHGYGAGIWVWEKQIESLSQYYQVIALDLIGHGFSDRPIIEYNPENYIFFFKGFMENIGIKKATLIGNSMGGGMAWAMAICHPEMVDRLVLINSISPNVINELKGNSFRRLLFIRNIPFLLYLAIALRNKDSIKRVLMDCVSNDQLIVEEVLNRQYEISIIKGTTWVLYSTFKNGRNALKYKRKLSLITHPTLLIWGQEDEILPVSVGEYLHRAIPRSKFYLIHDCGHIPMWEKPKEVNELIINFLREDEV